MLFQSLVVFMDDTDFDCTVDGSAFYWREITETWQCRFPCTALSRAPPCHYLKGLSL